MEMQKPKKQGKKKYKEGREKHIEGEIPGVLNVSELVKEEQGPNFDKGKKSDKKQEAQSTEDDNNNVKQKAALERSETEKTAGSVCGYCGKLINKELQAVVQFQCGHLYHFTCLTFYQSGRSIYKNCFMCFNVEIGPESTFVKMVLKNPITIYTGIYNDENRVESAKRLIIKLANMNGYTGNGDLVNYLRKPRKRRGGSKEKQAEPGVLDTLLGVLIKDRKTIGGVVVDKDKPSEAINMGVDIMSLMELEITMRQLRQQNMNVDILLQKGYGLVEWLCLNATWRDLYNMKLKSRHFLEYKNILDVKLFINVYATLDGITFVDFFDKICDKKTVELLPLNLGLQEYKELQFTPQIALELGLEVSKKGKDNALWHTLPKAEWKTLGLNF